MTMFSPLLCPLLLFLLPLSAPTKPAGSQLPLSRLEPAVSMPDVCHVKYRITTSSAECQAVFDQGLGFLYSYVWLEAVRSFETATRHDPNCPMAWWGLSRAFERYGKRKLAEQALRKADELKSRASYREQQLILARMQDKGLAPNSGNKEARRKAAIKTLDDLLAIYDDDEEAWFNRAQLACDNKLFGGEVSAVPFYKALLQVNPLHPGANHELVHFYENYRRPALGWKYAEGYIQSSPGIPHAFHMQAHLATRLGRWDKTSDRSVRAVELERAYHKRQNVNPRDDRQFAHHLEILLLSLIHDGRFREARAIKDEAWSHDYQFWLPAFRLHHAEGNWEEAWKIVEHYRNTDKATASYLAALIYLKQGDPERALPEVEVLQEAHRGERRRNNRQLQFRIWETQGWLMCQTGAADEGLKLLNKAVTETINDYRHHAWGNGAYYMEVWGIAALQAGRFDVAEEAFLEGLAHDPGSARSALGLQVLCEYLGRNEEACRYAELARRFWGRAEVQHFDAELAYLRGCISRRPAEKKELIIGASQGA